MSIQSIHTDQAPRAIGPYVQAARVNGFLYTSGQLGLDPASGRLPPDVEAQAHNAMKNIGAILSAAGADYNAIVKTTIFLTDLSDFSTVNAIYESYFDGAFPARSCVQVAALPLNGQIEIECVAALEA